jgi:hypothetical protein
MILTLLLACGPATTPTTTDATDVAHDTGRGCPADTDTDTDIDIDTATCPACPTFGDLAAPLSDIPGAEVEVLARYDDAADAYLACDLQEASDQIDAAWTVLDQFRTEDVHRQSEALDHDTRLLVDLEHGVDTASTTGVCP